MRLTTKGRYAVTAILDLALHNGDRPVRLTEISRRQAISLAYLEQLFIRLRRHGLVRSTRGPGGGYNLDRPAAEITIADILLAVGESSELARCAGKRDCQQGEACLTHDLWEHIAREINRLLTGIRLASLMEGHSVHAVWKRQRQSAAPAELAAKFMPEMVSSTAD